jgi:hypothetical protein
MLLTDGVLCPESLSDPRTWLMLCSGTGERAVLLHPNYLLAGVFRQGGPLGRDALTVALRHGRSLQDAPHDLGTAVPLQD